MLKSEHLYKITLLFRQIDLNTNIARLNENNIEENLNRSLLHENYCKTNQNNYVNKD